MKKLGKLSINPEKVMKNEELVNLKGGYWGYGGVGDCCHCWTTNGSIVGIIILPSSCSYSGCTTECKTVYGSDHFGVCASC